MQRQFPSRRRSLRTELGARPHRRWSTRNAFSASKSWKPSVSASSAGSIVRIRAPWRTTIHCSATPSSRGSRVRPSSEGDPERDTMCKSVGRHGKVNRTASPCRAASGSIRFPSISTCRSGSPVQRGSGPWPREVQEPAPDRVDDRASGQHRRAGGLWRLRPAAVGVLEQPAIAVVAVALAGAPLASKHVVRLQLDVVQRDLLGPVVPQDRPGD